MATLAPTTDTPPPAAPAPKRTLKDRAAALKARRKARALDREEARKRRRDANTDRLARRQAAAEHRRALRDLTEQNRAAEHARAERAADRAEQTALSGLYRRFRVSGARAQLTSQMERSVEARRLRVAAVRSWALRIGIPALLALGGWSTAGVHGGVVHALQLAAYTVGWWAAWVVEPVMITIVAWIIISRAVLRRSGGDVDWRAMVMMGGFLALSLALSILPVWPAVWSPEAVAALLAKAVGPVGTALVAHLIGMFDDYTRDADPARDAEELAVMRLEHEVPAGTVPPVTPAPGLDDGDARALAADPWEDEEEGLEDPHAFQRTEEAPADPWADAPKATPFQPLNVRSTTPGAGSQVTPLPRTNDGFWEALDAAGEDVTPRQRATRPPVEYTPPFYDGPRWEQAVNAYVESVKAGEPLSGRAIAVSIGVNPNSRKWTRKVVDAGKARAAQEADRLF